MRNRIEGSRTTQIVWLLLLIGWFSGVAVQEAQSAPRPQLRISAARYLHGQLQVQGNYRAATLLSDAQVRLHDRKLGSQLAQVPIASLPIKRKQRSFRFSLANPYDIPCAVRVSAEGAKDRFKTVRGAPRKNCSTGKTPPVVVAPLPAPDPLPQPTPAPTPTPSVQPECAILEPLPGAALAANSPITFRGRLKAHDVNTPQLTFEWDFAGGALERPTGAVLGEGDVEAKANFVRDNSPYRVRLTATDALGRRCEAVLPISVGSPPLPPSGVAELAAAAQREAPAPGGAVAKAAGELVVLPYEDWSMQCGTDARLVPNAWVVYATQVSNLKAQVFEKAQKPASLGPDRVSLVYRAASNPQDPVGSASINTTSQNWPVGTPLRQAEIQKTDIFETWQRPSSVSRDFTDNYLNLNWVSSIAWLGLSDQPPGSIPDQGFDNRSATPPINPDHGRNMPGIAQPYAANDAQDFSGFLPDERSFIARLLPVTDVDDAGRVNPFPLFRVEARTPTGQAVAATYVSLSVGRDLHCRECHAKGGLGANPNIYTQHVGHGGHTSAPPDYVDPVSPGLFDQEYAAIRNLARLHDFSFEHHVGRSLASFMDKGLESQGLVAADRPDTCATSSCHLGALIPSQFNATVMMRNEARTNGSDADPLSINVHRFHGQLQYNAGRTDVVRNEFGFPERWKPEDGANPNGLFPVKDGAGKPLPMEQNCLRCHGGQREQCYRDRMYTAGVTCYQCHGDMLAVGASYPKLQRNPDQLGYRTPWFDQPDCGSCHVGNANQGADGAQGFFSAGVKRNAFDDQVINPVSGLAEPNLAATPRQPDPAKPDTSRFAVPVTPLDLHWVDQSQVDPADGSGNLFTVNVQRVMQTSLFRLGKDQHGAVACAACHGAAHGIWPNRDPNANDNVTATQLQGHSGHLDDCRVCHANDAFARLENLDGGRFSGLPENSGLLGGPHGMHPVNDPYWWSQVGTSTTGYGGWHDDVYRKPGVQGVDQCAACHGENHAGTRLSKATADREFVLRDGIKATWRAGEPVGCDRCHTLEHSFSGRPFGSGLAANRPPSVTSTPVLAAIPGKPYRYQVTATDQDQDHLQFTLGDIPTVAKDGTNYVAAVQVDAATGLVSGVFPGYLLSYTGASPPFTVGYRVSVSDGRGGFGQQEVKVRLECPAATSWKEDVCQSDAITIEPDPAAPAGVALGGTYRVQPIYRHAGNQALSYRLSDAPTGMQIDARTGAVIWTPGSGAAGYYAAAIFAADATGAEAKLTLNLTVCAEQEIWDGTQGFCVGPTVFTSTPPSGLNLGEEFRYPVVAVSQSRQALRYALPQRAAGMAIDPQTGVMTWASDMIKPGEFSAEITATDTRGYRASQGFSLTVCAPPERFNSANGVCQHPITFSSETAVGGSVGQPLRWQVQADHAAGLTLTYDLVEAPTGMVINHATGLIAWTPGSGTAGNYGPTVVATDPNGLTAEQPLSISICGGSQHWDPDQQGCVD